MAKKRHFRRTASLLASWHFLKCLTSLNQSKSCSQPQSAFSANNDAGSRAQGLKLTPLIGDGNYSLGIADVSNILPKFKTNPAYRGRK